MLSPRTQSGFGMVDLLISMTLGMVLMGGLTTTYVSTIQGHANIAKLARLDHELHAMLELMARDIRRAGGNGNTAGLASGINNPFKLDIPSALAGEAANSCLTYSYDLDNDGVLDSSAPDERFGFRLSNKTIQMRRGGVACTDNGAGPNWESITEEEVVEITALSFTRDTDSAEGMVMQRVVVSISGRLKHDPAVNRTLSLRVRVRNDLYSSS